MVYPGDIVVVSKGSSVFTKNRGQHFIDDDTEVKVHSLTSHYCIGADSLPDGFVALINKERIEFKLTDIKYVRHSSQKNKDRFHSW